MTTLYLVRHGETVDNARQIMQGQTQGELNATGISQAEALRDEYEKRIADAKAEASDIVKSATRKAQLHGEEIVRDAQSQASRLMEKADAQIEQEKKKAMNELKNEISGIAVDIASKVVEREIDAKDHEALISEFIKGVGEAS